MKRYFLIISLLVVISAGLKAQQATRGEVNVIQDNRVDELLEKHRQINEAFNGLSGYRIQIFFDSGSNAKTRANNERRRFMALFPSVSAYIIFDAPNFKVRVGNFRSRLEAEKFLKDILKHFEMAYVVPSRIDLPKL